MRCSVMLSTHLLVAALCSGCIVIPTNFQSDDSRRNANKVDLRFLTVGQTTRGDVLRRLGEPDGHHYRQTLFLYRSSRDLVTAIPLVEGANSAPVVQKHYYMVLNFNAEGVLIKMERKSDIDWVL